MKHLSPMDAQRRLSYARKHGIHMSAEHRRAMETIAAMREEWGVHVTGYPRNIADWWKLCDAPEDHMTWHPDEESAEDFATERGDEGFNVRLVRRYVTEPEEA